MVKLPRYIRIAGARWSIRRREEEGCEGTCDTEKAEICINPGLADERVLEVLMHEVGHACIFVYGLKPLLSKESKDKEEEFLLKYTAAQVATLRENKMLKLPPQKCRK